MRSLTTTTARKVQLIILGTLLTVCALLIMWLHHARRNALQQDALSRLGGMTGTLAAQIDPGRIERLLTTYDSRGMLARNTQDPWYYVLHEAFRKAVEANHLDVPVQLVTYDAHKHELQVVASSSDRPMLRERYNGAAADICARFLTGSTAPAERSRTDTGLATIDRVPFSGNGLQAAVIAEVPMGMIEGRARAGLWSNISAAAALLLMLGLFLKRSVGRMVEREETARGLLEQRHAGFADSLAYAGKIQGALVPEAHHYGAHFAEHFLLNRPKDQVGGDFHWYHAIDADTCLVATADCTGHGLPGAMMAAIGCSLLNELAARHPSAGPAELLSMLNERMIATLHQDNTLQGRGDGMDIALCRVDRKQHLIEFAGAARPLYHVQQGALHVHAGDRMPVGGNQHGAVRRYTTHRLAYQVGDRIYLFSDGYIDQLGGPEGKRFMSSRFNDLLARHQHLPLAMQAELLDRAFQEWKGPHEQLDDICVLGLAV